MLTYLAAFFAEADWLFWLALMIPYSVFFFLVDSHVTWRVVRWFKRAGLAPPRVLPIRASAYILSLVNEQVGKGAMSQYLLRRYRVPGWQALSSMILLGLMEVYQLLAFSAIGVAANFHLVREASALLPARRDPANGDGDRRRLSAAAHPVFPHRPRRPARKTVAHRLPPSTPHALSAHRAVQGAEPDRRRPSSTRLPWISSKCR